VLEAWHRKQALGSLTSDDVGRRRRWDSCTAGWQPGSLLRIFSGVVFEDVDVPGLTTVDGIAEVSGNYPSKGVGERAAWFRDSEGNMLGIGQPTR
jgi:hypothetical protein